MAMAQATMKALEVEVEMEEDEVVLDVGVTIET